jgi:hypothetical protein
MAVWALLPLLSIIAYGTGRGQERNSNTVIYDHKQFNLLGVIAKCGKT